MVDLVDIFAGQSAQNSFPGGLYNPQNSAAAANGLLNALSASNAGQTGDLSVLPGEAFAAALAANSVAEGASANPHTNIAALINNAQLSEADVTAASAVKGIDQTAPAKDLSTLLSAADIDPTILAGKIAAAQNAGAQLAGLNSNDEPLLSFSAQSSDGQASDYIALFGEFAGAAAAPKGKTPLLAGADTVTIQPLVQDGLNQQSLSQILSGDVLANALTVPAQDASAYINELRASLGLENTNAATPLYANLNQANAADIAAVAVPVAPNAIKAVPANQPSAAVPIAPIGTLTEAPTDAALNGQGAALADSKANTDQPGVAHAQQQAQVSGTQAMEAQTTKNQETSAQANAGLSPQAEADNVEQAQLEKEIKAAQQVLQQSAQASVNSASTSANTAQHTAAGSAIQQSAIASINQGSKIASNGQISANMTTAADTRIEGHGVLPTPALETVKPRPVRPATDLKSGQEGAHPNPSNHAATDTGKPLNELSESLLSRSEKPLSAEEISYTARELQSVALRSRGQQSARTLTASPAHENSAANLESFAGLGSGFGGFAEGLSPLTSDLFDMGRLSLHTATSPAIGQHAARSLAVQINKSIKAGEDQFSVRMDPPSLGRVSIQLTFTGGGVSADILAERPETLTLLQREAKLLERALEEAGHKLTDDGISFSLDQNDDQSAGRAFADAAQEAKKDEHNNAVSADAGTNSDQNEPSAEDGDALTDALTLEALIGGRAPLSGLDIRV